MTRTLADVEYDVFAVPTTLGHKLQWRAIYVCPTELKEPHPAPNPNPWQRQRMNKRLAKQLQYSTQTSNSTYSEAVATEATVEDLREQESCDASESRVSHGTILPSNGSSENRES